MKRICFKIVLFFLFLLVLISCRHYSENLERAVLNDDHEEVKALVDKGEDPNSDILQGATTLNYAIGTDDLELVKYLVEKGADVNSGSPLTCLAQATLVGNMDIMQYLIDKGAAINGPSVKMAPPLALAASMGNAKAFFLLIKNGADLKESGAGSPEDTTLLHRAAFGQNPEIVRFLIEKGFDVNSVNSEGETSLHYSFKAETRLVNEESILLLLKNGADPARKDINGKTPEIIAMENQHIEQYKSLIKNEDME